MSETQDIDKTNARSAVSAIVKSNDVATRLQSQYQTREGLHF